MIPHLRIALRDENETLGKKIREGEMQKIPYLLIVGEKEEAKSIVSVRKRTKGDLGPMSINDFIKELAEELKTSQN
jgi:threonyl-tRNA synthetase